MFLLDLFPYPLLYPKFLYFCLAAKPKGQAANILKERRCTNALSAANRISQIPTLPYGKAMANAHVVGIYISLYILK